MADYLNLSEKELREYIRYHPDDEDAFQHYLSIVRSRPGRIARTEEEAEQIMREKLEAEGTARLARLDKLNLEIEEIRERGRQNLAEMRANQEEYQREFIKNQAESERILQSLQAILDRLTERHPDA